MKHRNVDYYCNNNEKKCFLSKKQTKTNKKTNKHKNKSHNQFNVTTPVYPKLLMTQYKTRKKKNR